MISENVAAFLDEADIEKYMAELIKKDDSGARIVGMGKPYVKPGMFAVVAPGELGPCVMYHFNNYGVQKMAQGADIMISDPAEHMKFIYDHLTGSYKESWKNWCVSDRCDKMLKAVGQNPMDMYLYLAREYGVDTSRVLPVVQNLIVDMVAALNEQGRRTIIKACEKERVEKILNGDQPGSDPESDEDEKN